MLLAPPPAPTEPFSEALTEPAATACLRRYGALQRRRAALGRRLARTERALGRLSRRLDQALDQPPTAGLPYPARRCAAGRWGRRASRPSVQPLPGVSPAQALARTQRLAPHYVLPGARLARRRLLADRHRPELQQLLPKLGLTIAVVPRLYIHPNRD
jgi:hypothetical protein